MDANKDSFIERRLPLSARQQEIMMAVLIRKESAYLAAQHALTAEHFTEYEQGYSIVWQSVSHLYEQFGHMPGEALLLAEVSRRIEEDPDALNDDDIESLDEFLKVAYALPVKQLKENVALRFLQSFLEDRLTDKARRVLDMQNDTPADVFRLMSQFAEEAVAIQTVAPQGVLEPFPENWQEVTKPLAKRTTTIGFFDRYLNGGDAAEEAIVLLAPYGSCKTTLAIQMGAERAIWYYRQFERQSARQQRRKAVLRYVYTFFYEGSMSEMRVRGLSYVGRIPKTTLEEGRWERLSTGKKQHTIKDYERVLYGDQNGYVQFGEQERLRFAQSVLNRNWRLVDMTGSDPNNPGRGRGMVDEIAALIRQDQQILARERPGKPGVGLVTVDYVGAAVEAHIDHKQLAHDKVLRHLVGKFPLHMINKVAKPFNTPVWLFHQLSAQANSFGPGVIPKMTDSAEGKAIAENAHFCFVIGAKNPNDQVILACRKGRRAGQQGSTVLQIQGGMARVKDLDSEYTLDPVGHQIVRRSDLNQVGTVDNTGYENTGRIPAAAVPTGNSSVVSTQRQMDAIRPRRHVMRGNRNQ